MVTPGAPMAGMPPEFEMTPEVSKDILVVGADPPSGTTIETVCVLVRLPAGMVKVEVA